MKRRIAILASGSGTNAENLVRYFADNQVAEVACVITNRRQAGVVGRMRALGIEVRYFERSHWENPIAVVDYLNSLRVDLVVLAGFLAMVREPLLTAFVRRIVNIHPSLLPRHGGVGMYGDHVHAAVLADGDSCSGITIHLVTEQVDGGQILTQFSTPVVPGDTVETLAQRVHQLEYQHYPPVVEQYLYQLD